MRDLVLVLNFDNAASRAVTRKLRSERVLCKIVPGDASLEEVQAQEPLGLILAGGAEGRIPAGLDRRLTQAGMPVLALGDAAGLLLNQLSGTVGDIVLQNTVSLLVHQPDPLLEGLENGERMLPCVREMRLPQHTRPLCAAEGQVIGFVHDGLPLYGLQLQVEQNDPDGSQLLRNFALNICGCTAWWDEDAFVARAVEEIRRVVGDGKAVCAMTGGLDSGVSALLAFKALGRQLTCIFVDTGLLREREGDDFMAFYRDALGMNIIRVDGRQRFIEALRGVVAADEKRRVIGELLQRILREEEEKLGAVNALIRATTCADVLFGGAAARPALEGDAAVIEPLRELFKEEIRRIGDYMGMPADIVSRQPFPGSGLALRILGEVTEDRLRILRAADAVFRAELQRSAAVKRLWQYFAVLWPMPGDETKAVICLRAVHASERIQTYPARLPYDVVENAVEAILRSQKDVCRVVYDLTPSSSYVGVEWQ